jgi:hypothetical protein
MCLRIFTHIPVSVVSTRDGLSNLRLLGRSASRLTSHLPSFRLPCSGTPILALSCVAMPLVCASPLAKQSISHLSSRCSGILGQALPSFAPSRHTLRVLQLWLSQPRQQARCRRYPWLWCSFPFACVNARGFYIPRVGVRNRVLQAQDGRGLRAA